MIKAGIAGAAGYTGGELIRILLRHPEVAISFTHSNSQAGKAVSQVHEDLMGDTDLIFSSDWDWNIDVLFLCVGHGAAVKLLTELHVPSHVRIIDLSQDFRDSSSVNTNHFVYGLPELNRSLLQHCHHVANPGCFATALTLGLLPLARSGFNGKVFSTGITGATGAGQGLSNNTHFAWRCNNIQAYKSLSHQHMQEVTQSLTQAAGGTKAIDIKFIPWRGDFARGIFISQQLETELSLDSLTALYKDYYSSHPFTHIVTDALHLKQVVNTNKCLIQIEQADGHTVIHSAIDNLLKGAAGQAVQNMNIMFGIEEKSGLELKASFF